jgi:hypothetical protein
MRASIQIIRYSLGLLYLGLKHLSVVLHALDILLLNISALEGIDILIGKNVDGRHSESFILSEIL